MSEGCSWRGGKTGAYSYAGGDAEVYDGAAERREAASSSSGRESDIFFVSFRVYFGDEVVEFFNFGRMRGYTLDDVIGI
jgi:hypothetical protein